MTNKTYTELANALIKEKYSVSNNCVELKTKLQNLQAEILTRTELQASSGCRNKTFGKDDCKQEQKIFLPILRQGELALKQAYNTNKCELVLGKIDSQLTQDQINQGQADVDASVGSKLRMQTILIYGVGLLAVGFGIYYFIKKKS
jgi:hypothetical protein